MKIIREVCAVLLSIAFLVLLATKWNFDNKAAFETIATFLSITTGFTITALSIIATSSFATHLYKLENSSNNSKTLLHNLVEQFKYSTFIFVTTIIIILIFKFLPTSTQPQFHIRSYPISVSIVLKSLIWYMTAISFFYFLKLFSLFSDFVIKTASSGSK